MWARGLDADVVVAGGVPAGVLVESVFLAFPFLCAAVERGCRIG